MQFSFVVDNSVWRTYGSPWLEMSAQGKLGALAQDSCRCFAQTMFGIHYHQQDIELQGMTLYGQTVTVLSEKLGDVPSRVKGPELITPILLLLMYASAKGDRQASYIHVVGLNKIMQCSQPADFAALPFRLAFESARSTLFTVSLVIKQRCFLDHPSWKYDPWGHSPKSPQNELVDILVNLPGYLQDLALIEEGTISKASLVVRLEADLENLRQWQWRWAMQNADAAWDASPASTQHSALCKSRVFKDALWFRNFGQSTEILLFNAVLICILGVLSHVSEEIYIVESPLYTQPRVHVPYRWTSAHRAAVEICRAFEYQLCNIRGSCGTAYFWLLPLGLASKVLRRNTLYKSWIDEMLAVSKSLRSHGAETSEFAFQYWSFLDRLEETGTAL